MASIAKHHGSWQYRVSYRDQNGKPKFISKSGFTTKKAASGNTNYWLPEGVSS